MRKKSLRYQVGDYVKLFLDPNNVDDDGVCDYEKNKAWLKKQKITTQMYQIVATEESANQIEWTFDEAYLVKVPGKSFPGWKDGFRPARPEFDEWKIPTNIRKGGRFLFIPRGNTVDPVDGSIGETPLRAKKQKSSCKKCKDYQLSLAA